MSGSGTEPVGVSTPQRRTRATTWHCPNPSEFSLLVVAQHLDIVVQLCGELDLVALGSLDACLEVVLREGPRRLVLDLSSLSFIDAAGVAVLLRARRRAEEADVALILDSPTAPVSRVLALADVDAEFTIR